MKKSFRHLLILCGISLIAVSCNDKDDTDPDPIVEKIKGEYIVRYTTTVGGEEKWSGNTTVTFSKTPKGYPAYPEPYSSTAITIKDDSNSPYFPFELMMCRAWEEEGVIRLNSRSMGEYSNPSSYNEMVVDLDVEFTDKQVSRVSGSTLNPCFIDMTMTVTSFFEPEKNPVVITITNRETAE